MVEFQRDYTAKRLNAVANHPAVFPFIAMKGQESGLDLSPLINNLNNIALMCDDGGIMALSVELGVYEIHTQFTGELRGAAAVRLVRDMVSWLFLNSPATELLTQVPVNNTAALGLVRSIAGRFEFTRKDAWVGLDGIPCDVDYYVLRWNDWLWSDWAMKSLEAKGHEFHRELERQQQAMGYVEPQHPDDLAHDVAVGATVTLFRNGWLDKATILYNRWARFAGYAEIGLVSRQPPLVAFGGTLIEVSGQDFRVVRVPSPVVLDKRSNQQIIQSALIEAGIVGDTNKIETPFPTTVGEEKELDRVVAEVAPTSDVAPDLVALIQKGRENKARAKANVEANSPQLDAFAPWTPSDAERAVAAALDLGFDLGPEPESQPELPLELKTGT